MKKLFALLMGAVFALGTAGAAVAQENAATGTETKTTTTTKKTTKAVKAKQLTGTVESVDASAGTLTVKPSKGEAKTLKAGEKVKMDTLNTGDKVTVRYKGDTATSVKVTKSGKSAKEGGTSDSKDKTTTTTTTEPSGSK